LLRSEPYLFLAEEVRPFEEKDVKRLVLALQAHFPNSELVFDVQSPVLTVQQNWHNGPGNRLPGA
jgi:hypothetical protein